VISGKYEAKSLRKLFPGTVGWSFDKTLTGVNDSNGSVDLVRSDSGRPCTHCPLICRDRQS